MGSTRGRGIARHPDAIPARIPSTVFPPIPLPPPLSPETRS